jgi:hypothetical protein
VWLRDSFVAALAAADAERVVREAVGEFRDGRGHAPNAADVARRPSIQCSEMVTTGRRADVRAI